MEKEATVPEVTRPVLTDIQNALERYRLEVEASRLTEETKRTYLLHAKNFVRWLADDFTPGSTL
jgi:hypothetical protein